MKKLFLLSLLCLLSFVLWADIMSTTYGGNWMNPSTWMGGVVPNSSTTNVIIQANVILNNNVDCYNLSVTPMGRVSTNGIDIYQITIYGNCFNQGQLVDSGIPGGELRLVVLGNLTNIQTITCEYVYFAGDNPHTFSSYGTFSPTHFLNLQTAEVTFSSNVSLNGTHISLPHLSFTGQVTLSGGFIEHTNITGGGSTVLNLSNGAYLSNVTATEIVLMGAVLISNVVSIGNIYNNGTIYNRNDADCTLSISGRLNNNGTITNNPSGHYLNLTLQGDIYNYLTIAPNYLTLGSENVTHDILQSSGNAAISAPNINVMGDYRMLSNLTILNSNVSWNSHALIMHNGGGGYILNLNGGTLAGVEIESLPGSTLNLSNNAWIGGITAGDLSFDGTVLIGDGVEIDRLINLGTLRSRGDFPHTLVVRESLRNNGNIYNASSGNWLYVSLYGDLINYGQIGNYQFTLYGQADQSVLRGTGSNISCSGGFRIYSNIGYANWYFNGQATDSSFTDLRTIDPAVSGVWNPMYYGLQGKNIIIGNAQGTLPAPQDPSSLLIDGNVRLYWHQVPGAIYYTVLSASTPDGAFTALPAKVFDYNLGDGLVSCDLMPSTPFRFYKVTAGN